MADQEIEKETLLKTNEEIREMDRLMAGDDDVAKVLQDIQTNLIKDLEKSNVEKDDVVNRDCQTKAQTLQDEIAKGDPNLATKEEKSNAQKIMKEIDTFLDEVSDEETWEDIEMLSLDTEKEKKKDMEYDEISTEEESKNESAENKDNEVFPNSTSTPSKQNEQTPQKDYLLEDVSSNSEMLTETSDIETKEKEVDPSLILTATNDLVKVEEEKSESMVVSEEPKDSIEKDLPKEDEKDLPEEDEKDLPKEEEKDLLKEELKDLPKEEEKDLPKEEEKDLPKEEEKDLPKEEEQDTPKEEEKEPLQSPKDSKEKNEKPSPDLDEVNTATEKSPENNKEELSPIASPIKIIEDIELPDKAPLEVVQNEENIEKEISASLETPSEYLNDETSQGSLVIDEKPVEEANEILDETSTENEIVSDTTERKDSETITTENLESSENKVAEHPLECVETILAEETAEETSKTKTTETEASQPKSPSTEKRRSQLTDGEIISLDSSDDEEPKTVEEVCKAPNKSENEKESETTPMEVDDDSVKETTPKEISANTDESQQNDIKEEKKEDFKDSLLEKSSGELQNMVDSENENYEIFFNKECINCECPKAHKQYYRATQFTLSYYNITKKKKLQYVCTDCYMQALDMFEELCGLLVAKQPILISNIHAGKPEFVEILDSSDEEESETTNQNQESSALSADCLDLIEKELDNTIRNTLIKIDVQKQLTWSKTILTTRLKNLEAETKKIEEDLKNLQTKADKMHDSLYRTESIKISNLPPLDLNTGRTYIPTEEPLKPFGEITRPPIEINGTYYAVKNKPLASWVPCRVVEKVESLAGNLKGVPQYKVKFIGSQYHTLKTLPVKHLAYFDPPPVRLQIGTRVIAYFDATTLTKGKEKCAVQSAFYPGIIAEPLKHNNRFRYLIFYDDGYTQYVHPNDVRLVCQQSEKVWDDVHPGSRDFIENYVTQYNVNRPMVQTHKGQSMNTESNGTWIYARVVDIDCSLVKMHFEQGKGHTEWIYRGSLRLGPVFREYHKMQKESNQSRLRRTEPFIRYTADDEMTPAIQSQRPVPPLAPIQPTLPTETQQRAVARKTTSRSESVTQTQTVNISSLGPTTNTASVSANAATIKHLNNETIYLEDENIPKGKVVYYTAKRNLPPRRYRKHECHKGCLFAIQHNLNVYSPLSKPLLSGWERMVYRQKVKKSVVYRAPCGKMLRDMLEVRNYLRATENVLNVDNFDFRPETCCLAEYVIDKAIITKRDITNGLEKMPLPLVNYYDNTLPDCTYAAQRIPKDDVHINTDPEFLVGCDCEDDCLDKSKCSCWQLTLEGAKYGNPNMSTDEVGYQYKRLMDPVPTGIYECNARCKCKSHCLNRVVQYPLQMKLQVFKTNNRGWGLRCINDIPKGSFICIYAGNLLTNSHANEGGLDAGDEYFAELDLIETAEQYKEGYESDVVPPEEADEDDDSYHEEEDDDFRPSRSYIQRSKKERSTRTSHQASGNDESKERRMINFNPNADLDESKRKPSIRQFYGNDDGECYVMDAKTIGNLGRYFNHSCSPNLFVQSVFVDTHDLRFPWVAFFALLNIRAGTELTWNYNYEVGVVPGKVLYCECGAPNCRQRLL